MNFDIGTMLQIINAITAAVGLPVLIWLLFLLRKQTGELTTQTRVASHATRAGIYQSVAEQMIEIDRVFLEYRNSGLIFMMGLMCQRNILTDYELQQLQR